MGDHKKGRFPKKLKSFMDVPYVAYLKVQVLSFNMNSVIHFGEYLGDKVKGRSPKRLKILIEVP